MIGLLTVTAPAIPAETKATQAKSLKHPIFYSFLPGAPPPSSPFQLKITLKMAK
jgi:hypothetical protein